GVGEILIRQVVIDAGDLHGAGKSGKGPGNEHGDDKRAADTDAGVASSALTLADGPDLVTQRCSPEQEGKHGGGGEGDEHSGMRPINGARKIEDHRVVMR